MTKTTNLSLAEQSRLAAKTALDLQAEEKKRENEDQNKRLKDYREKSQREDEQRKDEAAIIGHKLYLLLRDRIKEEEVRGHLKLEGDFGNFLYDGNRKLLHHTNETLTCLAFNHAAERLREGDYRVRFGRGWSAVYYADPYGSSSRTESASGISWSEDATRVPHHTDSGGSQSFGEKSFPALRIEVDWSGEKSK